MKKNEVVLVTGASGLTGRYILQELLQQTTFVVKVVIRKTSQQKDILQFLQQQKVSFEPHRISWFVGDITDALQLEEVFVDVTQVYHCAAKVSFNPSDRKELMRVNVATTEKIVNLALEKKVDGFLYISSVAALGTPEGGGEVDESNYWNKGKDASYYAYSKYLGEMEVWRGIQEGLQAVILNPGVIIGSWAPLRSSAALFARHEQKYNFYTTGGIGMIDVRDVAQMAVQLMEKKIFGERFILISENVTIQSVTEKICEILKKTKPKLISNNWLKVLICIAPLLKWFVPKLREINSGTYKSLTEPSTFVNTKILQTLDYQCISIDDALTYHGNRYVTEKSNQ